MEGGKQRIQKKLKELGQEKLELRHELSDALQENKSIKKILDIQDLSGLKLEGKPDFILDLLADGSIRNFVSLSKKSHTQTSITHLKALFDEDIVQQIISALQDSQVWHHHMNVKVNAFYPYPQVQLSITKQFNTQEMSSFLVMGFLVFTVYSEEQKIKFYKDTFLNFSEDPLENINKLTATLGSLLNATVALYNRLDEDMLISWGQWNTPADYQPKDKPEGHLCYDVIRGEKDRLLLVRDLQNTAYAESDPNVKKYHLETYIGYPVANHQRHVGSICAVFQNDYFPQPADIRVLQTIAYAISSQEKRLQKEKELKQKGDLLHAVNKIGNLLAQEATDIPFQTICQIVGEASRFDSVRILKNHSKDLSHLQIDQVAAWGNSLSELGDMVLHHICKIGNAQKWHDIFMKGEPIAAQNKDFPEAVSQVLAQNNIQSFLLTPVIIASHFEYLILVVNGHYQHHWTDIEKEFLISISHYIEDDIVSRRLKKQLADENKRFQTVMDTLNSAVYVCDMTTYQLIYYNKFVAKQIEGVKGHYCYDLVLGKDKPCRSCALGLLLDEQGNAKHPVKWKYYYEREKKWFFYENKAIDWVDGKKVCLTIGTDITAMVKQEKELENRKDDLKEQRDFYRRMMDNTSDLIWAKDVDGKYLFANRAVAEKLLIANVKEIKGKTDIFFAERQRKLKPQQKDYHTFGELCLNSDQIVIDNPSKSHRFDEYGNVQGSFLFLDVLKSPLFDKNGELIGIVGSSRVVTKEKEIEKELKKSEEKFRSFFEKNRAAMLQIDVESKKIIDANEAAVTFYGYSKEEIISKYIYDINTQEKEVIDEEMKETLNYTSRKLIFKHRLANGVIRDVNVFASPIELQGKLCIFTMIIDVTRERKIREALSDSEEKYRMLVESTTDIIARISLDGRLLYASPNAKNMVGYDIEGKLGKHISTYIQDKDQLQLALHILRNIPKNRESGVFEAQLEFHDARRLHAEVKYSPIIIDGEVDSVHLIVSDISERVKALEALKESEKKYKFLVENTTDVIAQISPSGILIYMSPNIDKILGYHVEKVIGKPISVLFSTQRNLEKAQKMLKYILSNTESGITQFYYEYKQGEKVLVEMSYSPIIVNNTLKSIHFVIRDISHRHQAQLKLKESEFKLKEAQKLAKVGHWEFILQTGLIYLSEEVYSIFELDATMKPLSVNQYIEIIHPKDRLGVRLSYIDSIKKKEEYQYIHRIQLKGGRIKYVSQRAYHVFDEENGRVIRTVGTIQDITKIKESELALKASKEQLSELNNKLLIKVKNQLEQSREKDRILLLQSRQASMGEMIGNIAHQWRQPLNEMSLLMADMEDAFEYNELTEDYFQKAVTQAKASISYMSQTIDDFRNFFIESSDIQYFFPAEAIHRSIQFVKRVFEEKQIELSYKLDQDIRMKGKANLLSQAILNILNNAKDTFGERKTSNPKLMISLKKEGNDIKIDICDNAGGIDKEIIDKIFEPYFTTKGEKSGTGLGLYMAQTIVSRQLKGILYATNKSSGACFSMEF